MSNTDQLTRTSDSGVACRSAAEVSNSSEEEFERLRTQERNCRTFDQRGSFKCSSEVSNTQVQHMVMNSQKVPKVVEVPKWQYTGEHEWEESRRHVCDRNVRFEIVGWSGTNVQELWCRVWANVQLFYSRSRQALTRDWKELWVCILVETWVPWPIEWRFFWTGDRYFVFSFSTRELV